MRQKKIWGYTQEIFNNSLFELHRLEFKKGYYCSEHLHRFKFNAFFVENGKLKLRIWDNQEDSSHKEIILKAGDFYKVKPGHFHQFEGLQSGVAFEIYWSEYSSDDIERRNKGSRVKHKK